jgi:hypothetical protein
VAGLTPARRCIEHFQVLYLRVVQLPGVILPSADVKAIFLTGSSEDRAFVRSAAAFLTTFLRVRCCFGFGFGAVPGFLLAGHVAGAWRGL